MSKAKTEISKDRKEIYDIVSNMLDNPDGCDIKGKKGFDEKKTGVINYKCNTVKQFSVGHRAYKVSWQKSLIAKQYSGRIDHLKGLIQMQSGHPAADEFETLLHERLHGVCAVLGEPMPERLVHRLSSLLAQALLTAE